MKLIALTVPGLNGTPTAVVAPTGIPTGYRLEDILGATVQLMMVIGIVLSLIYLTYGGLFWIQTKGDKEQLDKARRIITYAIIGLIVMSLSFVLVNTFTAAVGIKGLSGIDF